MPGLVYVRATMQVAHMVHAVATVLMMACSSATSTWAPSACAAPTRPCARLRRRDLGQGAPRLLVRRHQGRQDPGPAQQAAVDRPTRRRQPVRPPEESRAMNDSLLIPAMLAAVAGRRAGQAAAAGRRRQGQGRRSRRQDRLARQGRGLPVVQVAGPRRRCAPKPPRQAGRARPATAGDGRAATPPPQASACACHQAAAPPARRWPLSHRRRLGPAPTRPVRLQPARAEAAGNLRRAFAGRQRHQPARACAPNRPDGPATRPRSPECRLVLP
jgi:hypothetical protein